MKDKTNEPKPDVIAGRNPVSEAIRSGRPIDKILVARGEKTGAVVGILAKAREKQIPVKEADRVKLDFLSGSAPHQGIIALAAAKEYSSVEDILAYAAEKGEPPFLIVLDELEDQKAGRLDLRRGHERHRLHPMRHVRRVCAGDRQRGQGHGAFGARKVRRDRFAAHEGTYQFFERLGRRRYPDVPRAAGQKIERM